MHGLGGLGTSLYLKLPFDIRLVRSGMLQNVERHVCIPSGRRFHRTRLGKQPFPRRRSGAVHPAHRFGDQMIDVRLETGSRVRFSDRSLVWAWCTLRMVPGDSARTVPLIHTAHRKLPSNLPLNQSDLKPDTMNIQSARSLDPPEFAGACQSLPRYFLLFR